LGLIFRQSVRQIGSRLADIEENFKAQYWDDEPRMIGNKLNSKGYYQ
jgi:hypothetical protein